MAKFFIRKNNAFVEHSYTYLDIFDVQQKDEDCRASLKNGLVEFYYKKFHREIILTYSQFKAIISFRERIEIKHDTEISYKIWIDFNA